MKRIAIMTAALLAATTTFGQERRWSLDYHAGLGLTRFVNYPALSAIEDRTPSYTGLTASFTLALKRDDGFALGLRYRNTEVATAAVSLREEATVHDVSVLVRHSTMVTPRLARIAASSSSTCTTWAAMTSGPRKPRLSR